MANEQTIDELNIKINTEAKQSSSGMDKLIASIEKLKNVTGGGVGNLTGIAASLSKLTTTLDNMKGKSGSVSSLANSIQKLNDLRTDRVSSNIGTLTQSLKTLEGMDSGLKVIISDLATLARSGNGSVAENAIKLQADAAKAQATIDKSALTSAKAQEGLKAITDRNAQIEETARAAAAQEQALADAIQSEKMKYSGGGSYKFPNDQLIMPGLESVAPDYEDVAPDITKRAMNSPGGTYSIDESIKSLKASMGEVGDAAGEAGKVGAVATTEIASGSSRATSFVDRLKESLNSAKGKLSELGSSSQNFFSMGRFYGLYFILRQVAAIFGGFINNINSYIENQNLFAVAMGKSAQSGRQLADSLQSVLGVDSGEAMRYMGLFQQMTTSFGVTNKQATIMSENFTQLGYDIASFYNISTSDAFTKLQSGLAGQTRSLRTLGIDISNARLQQELYNLGIKEKVKDLNEADKAELIYIAVMKQTGNAQGDMARTIQTPANALRVLQAQTTIAGRALGSIFVPALEMILPPAIAATEVVGDLASEVASLAGFKMPKIDYSSLKNISNTVDDAADSAGKAADGVSDIGDNAEKSKKQLNDLIGGFDELNILQQSNEGEGEGKSKKSGSGDIGSVLGGIDLPSYDALSGAIGNNIDALKQKIIDFLKAFRDDPLTTFANALWGVGGAFDGLHGWLSKMDYAGILTGISTAVMAYGITKNPVLAIAIGAVTAALTELFPEKARIDLLNGSLATLGGALVLKTFTGMPFKLALGISTLATSGLIELIGKDNAINLLASSLTGLGAGIMAFTFSENLPLALAIGATTSALSGMAIHFSEFRIAPALLTGVSSALLAFKFGGFSQGSAGLVGLGIAIGAFAELNNFAPALQVALLGLAGAITGIGTAIRLGFGTEGLIITAVAGAFIGLGAGLIQASEDAKRANLEKRFGSISLSAQECEDIAERLTKTPWTIKIDAAIDANGKLKELEKNVENDISTLNKLNWKVSVGMQLTKGEMSDYKQAIDSFISDAKSYVQQQHYSVSLAIEAAYQPGSNTQKNLQQFVNNYYGNAQKQLDSLGKQLSDEVNKAFSDGILTPGETIKMSEIEQKMQKIIDKISDAEYKAKLDNLTADVSDKGLTPDSFKSLQKQIQNAAQDRLSKAEEVRLKATAAAELQWDESKQTAADKTAFEKAKTDAQSYFDQQKATIDLTGMNVSLNTLNKNFKDAVAASSPFWKRNIGDIGSKAVSDGWAQAFGSTEEEFRRNVPGTLQTLERTYSTELSKLPIGSDTRAALKSCLEKLKPTVDDLQTIANNSKKAGTQVPENVAKGLADAEQLGAIAGNEDAINYMLGKKLSTDPSFLNTLATAKDAGKNVDSNLAQGLTDSLQYIRDSSTGAIIGIKDSVSGKVYEITPTLRQNLSDLGVNMTNSLVSSINSNKPNVTNSLNSLTWGVDFGSSGYSSGTSYAQSFANGIRSTRMPEFSFNWNTGKEETAWWSDKAWAAAAGGGTIRWNAAGGVYDRTSLIGVGEYAGAQSNPEIVTPQDIMKQTVDESNKAVINAISSESNKSSSREERLIAMMRVAFEAAAKEAGGDITIPISVNMDGDQVAHKVSKIQKKDGRRFVAQPT